MSQALLIVHLSTLDAYVWEYGAEKGHRLAEALRVSFSSPGPLIITDEGAPLLGKESQARKAILESLQGRAQVTWFAHDDIEGDWEVPMQRLGQVLRDQGLTHLRIGGVFATRDGSRGCVNETMKWLAKQGFYCTLDAALCGFEEEERGE